MSTPSEPVPAADPAQPANSPAPAPAAASPAAEEQDAAVVRAVEVADDSRRRRAPRYGRFAFVGFLLAALVSLVLTLAPVGDSDLAGRDLFFLLLLGLGTAGVFAGLLVALLADRRSLRRRDSR